MKPSTLTVFELFEKERRYVVPLFQRPYVWTEEKQWQPLWDDITAKADQLLYFRDEYQEVGRHFLGAAVLNEIKTFGRQVAAREIIDGQQRLTTLQIALAAFRDYLIRTGGDDDTLRILNRLTLNDCRMEQELERYKVWPTTADRQYFETALSVGTPDLLDELYPLTRIPRTNRFYERPRLVEAYQFFYHQIEQYLQVPENGFTDKEPDQIQCLDALTDAITKYMELVIIELEERDDPQIIFETLNARGEPLLPSDLIRNYVFLEANRQHQDVERLYEDYWRHFDEYETGDASFWKEEERQGRLKRPRIDLFMFHFLVFQTGRDFLITHLFQEFRRWWTQLPRELSIAQRLQIVYTYSQVYKGFFEPAKEPSRLDLFVQRLRTLDTSTVYPVLLYLYGGEAQIDLEERNKIIVDIESYLVRRLVCRLSSKNYNRIFLIFLRNLRRAEHLDRTFTRQLLLDLKGDAVRWPGDAEFGKAWMMNPAYEWITQGRVRMLLEAIDLQLETNRQEQLHIKTNLTIEHIYPQNPEAGAWPPLEQETLLHTFGNLTLLTQRLNSSISNGPFARKRPEIARQSRLRLNVYFQDYRDEDIWSAADIVQRGAKLFEVTRHIWPHPLANGDRELAVEAIVTEISVADEYNDDPIADEESQTPDESDINHDVYEYLKQVAREERTVTYTEIAQMVGLNMQSQLDRSELGEILGAISTHEHRQNRPLLSVVTVFSNEGIPSNDFFNLAKKLGKFSGSTEMEKITFFANELKAAYEYWQSQD